MMSLIQFVQLLCVVLMLCMGLWIGLFAPQITRSAKVYFRARTLILIGIASIILHFSVQFFLHENPVNIADKRTLVNLVLGFPISYFMNISLVYLLRKGTIRIFEWLVIPIFYLSALIVAVVLIGVLRIPDAIHITNIILSVYYGLVLLICCILQFMGYNYSMRHLQHEGNDYFVPVLRWGRWVILVMVVVSLGFPFMTFCKNEVLRSAYGLMAIFAGFMYSVCFYLMGLSPSLSGAQTPAEQANPTPAETDENDSLNGLDKELGTVLSARDVNRVETAVEKFVGGNFYLQSGITIKDVVREMGIPIGLFRAWLHTTPYEKFNNWLVSIRLERAKQLLLKGGVVSNKEVALRCGFCDRYYFQSQFRKFEGMSPFQWIENHRINTPPICRIDFGRFAGFAWRDVVLGVGTGWGVPCSCGAV